jgi:Tfp pilus assembly protein PilF
MVRFDHLEAARAASLFSAARAVAAALLLALAATLSAEAEPFRPSDDATVLERLRPANDPLARELKALAAEVRARPDDLAAALHLARRSIEAARTEGDPRYAGHAEAALQPWLAQDPPPAVLLMRATLRQYGHDFAGALADLDRVLAQRPDDAQARLTRATLHQVQADYAAARADCAALDGRTLALVQSICEASLRSLTGAAAAAYDDLAAALEAGRALAPDGLQAWALQTLAEIAARRGDAGAAEAHLRAALELAGDDLGLTCALADLLLEQGRAAEARALLGEDLRPDLLLLRRVLVAQALGDPDFARLARELEARFAASALRGDQRHLREEVRFRLALGGQAGQALDLAARNWASQREPVDAELYLAAALAAGRPEAAAPVVGWARATGLEGSALAGLITRIEAALP